LTIGLLLGSAPSAGADEPAPPFVDLFGASGTGNGQFDEVLALAVDRNGNWYAGDYRNHRIEKFEPDGDFIQVIGGPGEGNGQMENPNGLVVYHDDQADTDRLLLSDAGNSRLQVFSLGGTWIQTITTVVGATPTGFASPAGLAVGPDGRFYVADRLNERVLVLDPDFTLDHEIELGPLNVYGVALSPAGDELYVVTNDELVHVFATDTWAPLDTFGNTGPLDEQLNSPYHVTTDELGFLYIGDSGDAEVQKYTPSGRHVWRLESASYPMSGVFMALPAANGLLAVTDNYNDRVQVFDLCPGGFTDVPESHPFWFEICWMDSAEVSTGYADDTYRPTEPVSRQAMSAFLVRAVGPDTWLVPGTPTFPDVPNGHPFYDEIEWMAGEGIAGGYADGKFHPGASVSRQAMSAFMYRAAGSPSFTPPVTPTFDDVPATHQFYEEIEWMVAEGITTGFSDGTYRPGTAVSRQAMSAFLARLALIV
jgi:DNA-binding beta-propeller fold protein YncE